MPIDNRLTIFFRYDNTILVFLYSTWNRDVDMANLIVNNRNEIDASNSGDNL
jgi:hypothetical protein